MTAAVARPHSNRIELNRGQRLSYGDFSAAVGSNAANGDPNEVPRRLGSVLPAAKSADRVLDSSDAGSELRTPAAGATKRSHSRSRRRKGAAASKRLIGWSGRAAFMSCRTRLRGLPATIAETGRSAPSARRTKGIGPARRRGVADNPCRLQSYNA
jgi:hypothetical protein